MQSYTLEKNVVVKLLTNAFCNHVNSLINNQLACVGSSPIGHPSFFIVLRYSSKRNFLIRIKECDCRMTPLMTVKRNQSVQMVNKSGL